MRASILAAALAACALVPLSASANTMELPENVRPPAGHSMSLHTVGVGEITYECRAKAGGDTHEWVFVAPVATLADRTGKAVGRYYGGPTWEAADGSKVTGKQVAIAPAAKGSIPLQLVKAEPATGVGAMTGVTYIQRINTKGGVAPSEACDANRAGTRAQVRYEADYVFYRM